MFNHSMVLKILNINHIAPPKGLLLQVDCSQQRSSFILGTQVCFPKSDLAVL